MKEFMKGVFSEPFGPPSFARTTTGLIVTFVLGWDTAYMSLAWQWNAHHLVVGQLPLPLLPDASTLMAQAAFITVLYGVNKATSALGKANEQ